MVKRILFVVISISFFFIEGCAVETINKYRPTANHIKVIKEKYSGNGKDVKIKINNYKPNNPGTKAIGCGLQIPQIPVIPPNKMTFESYIVQALIDDMKFAGIYSDESSTSFNVNFEKIDFHTMNRQWIIIAEFSTDNNMKFNVASEYNWDILFGDAACSKAARVFPKAVENFIYEVIKHPDFQSVFNNKN